MYISEIVKAFRDPGFPQASPHRETGQLTPGRDTGGRRLNYPGGPSQTFFRFESPKELISLAQKTGEKLIGKARIKLKEAAELVATCEEAAVGSPERNNLAKAKEALTATHQHLESLIRSYGDIR